MSAAATATPARTLVLYTVAHIAASSATERATFRFLGPVLGRMHRAAYDRVLPVDERRLALWTPVHLLHGWSQAVGVHGGIFDDGETRDASVELIPLALVDELWTRRAWPPGFAVPEGYDRGGTL